MKPHVLTLIFCVLCVVLTVESAGPTKAASKTAVAKGSAKKGATLATSATIVNNKSIRKPANANTSAASSIKIAKPKVANRTARWQPVVFSKSNTTFESTLFVISDTCDPEAAALLRSSTGPFGQITQLCPEWVASKLTGSCSPKCARVARALFSLIRQDRAVRSCIQKSHLSTTLHQAATSPCVRRKKPKPTRKPIVKKPAKSSGKKVVKSKPQGKGKSKGKSKAGAKSKLAPKLNATAVAWNASGHAIPDIKHKRLGSVLKEQLGLPVQYDTKKAADDGLTHQACVGKGSMLDYVSQTCKPGSTNTCAADCYASLWLMKQTVDSSSYFTRCLGFSEWSQFMLKLLDSPCREAIVSLSQNQVSPDPFMTFVEPSSTKKVPTKKVPALLPVAPVQAPLLSVKM